MKIQGQCVSLAAPPSGDESPWNVLAYEVALEGRGGVVLSRADFDQCVANFMRWGKEVPVVLYHADTDPMAHPASREAHAWITAMRVGALVRNGHAVATLEARFRWVNAETRESVRRGALAFGSVTIVQNGVDEESGDAVGSYLWSFSLTNNPALVDLPRIAAESSGALTASASDTSPMPDGRTPVPLSLQGNTMQNTMLTLAARLGIASANEDDATRSVIARAEETLVVRRQLGLSADAGVKDVESAITMLAADGAKVAVLSAELDALKVREAERNAREVADHVDALCADPSMAKTRAALTAFARADYAAFSKEYPRPTHALSSLTSRVTASRDGTPAPVFDLPRRHNDAALERAQELMAKENTLTLEAALRAASRELTKKAVR